MTDPEAAWQSHYVHPGAWNRELPPLTLSELFAATVARVPDARLTDFMGARLSYAEVAMRARRFAAALQARGVIKGDRVGLYLPNVPDYPIAYYGAFLAGAIVVNMSPLYAPAELEHQVRDAGARVIVTTDVPNLYTNVRALLDAGMVDTLIVGAIADNLPPVKALAYRWFKRAEIAAVAPGEAVLRLADIVAHDVTPTPVTVTPDDVALIQYTGGTTGVPKGAMLTHQNLSANARQVTALDPHAGEPDRIVGVLPFFHVFANTCVLNRTVNVGGLIAMLPRFDAGATLKTIARVRATALPGVPTMYQALLDHPAIGRTDCSSLRVCISGGAPLPAIVKQRFEAATGARVVEGYGLTESSGVVACNPYEGASRDGTIGQPVPGTRIRLLDREDATQLAPAGEPGELAFLGPQAMAGYWGHPEADAAVFAGEWVRTGDVATIDDAGFIAIVDRIKDMISVGGFKVFPSQVEAVLYRHPDVREAIVIGIPDDYAGERPKAFVTLNPDAAVDSAAIMAWANPQLGKHERVAAVEVRDELPKTLVGKLSRKELVVEERARAA